MHHEHEANLSVGSKTIAKKSAHYLHFEESLRLEHLGLSEEEDCELRSMNFIDGDLEKERLEKNSSCLVGHFPTTDSLGPSS